MANTNQTIVSQFGKVYDPNAINKLALELRLKPLSVDQLKGMTDAQIKSYLAQGKTANKDSVDIIKKISRTLRANAKPVMSENMQHAKLMHNTIRQGLAELGSLGAQLIQTTAISKKKASSNAVEQNIGGGTSPDVDTNPTKDPTINSSLRNYSFSRRKEE